MHSTRPPSISFPPGHASMPPAGFASVPHFASYGAPPPEEPTPREQMARLKTLARRSLGHWKPAAAIMVLGCAASVGLALQQKLIFRSECSVSYRLGKGESDESGVDRVMRLAPRLRQVLTTRARLESIVRDFALYPRIVDGRGMGEAVDEAREHIEVRGRDSETFFLSFESESPETAQQVTQRLAEDMISEFESQKVLQAKQKAEFVAREQEQAESRMDDAEKALSTFAGEHPVMAAAVRGALPGSADLLVAAQQATATKSGTMRGGSGATGAAPESAFPTSVGAVLAQLTAARDEAAARVAHAQQELQDKLANYTEQHPDVSAARSYLGVAQRALETASGRLDRAKAEAQATAPPTAASKSSGPSITRTRTQPRTPPAPAALSPSGEAEVRLEFERRLRGVRDARELYTQRRESLEKANLELSAARATANESMAILDPANLASKPYKGGRSKVAFAGGFVTLILALGYAVARVLLDDRVHDPGDLRQLGLRPPLGVVPRISSAPRGRRG